jgi:glycosyltransferase involved in cell wall biosynthesis
VKVLHVNTEAGWGGGEQQVLTLMRGLRAFDVAQELLARTGSPLAARAREAAFPVHEERFRGGLGPRAAWRLGRRVKEGDFDLVHAHTAHAHGIAWLSAGLRGWRSRSPLVVSRRVTFSIHRRGLLGLNRWKYARGVDCFLCASASIREVLVREGVPAARLTVVRDGIDRRRILYAPDRDAEYRAAFGLVPGEPVVGSIGNLVEAKGHRHLIDAFARVVAARPGARCLIVGGGPLEGELGALIAERGLTACVRLLGFRDDVPSLLRLFDVFCFPSLDEGLGTSLLDAMARGVPVVASDAGGIPEAVEDGREGRLVPAGDADRLAVALLDVLADPAAARAYGEAGRARVAAAFTAERMVEETLAAYQSLAPRAGRRQRVPPEAEGGAPEPATGEPAAAAGSGAPPSQGGGTPAGPGVGPA